MATINVSRKVRKEGTVKVKETAKEVLSAITLAKREGLDVVVFTEADGSKHGRIWAVKHALINSVE